MSNLTVLISTKGLHLQWHLCSGLIIMQSMCVVNCITKCVVCNPPGSLASSWTGGLQTTHFVIQFTHTLITWLQTWALVPLLIVSPRVLITTVHVGHKWTDTNLILPLAWNTTSLDYYTVWLSMDEQYDYCSVYKTVIHVITNTSIERADNKTTIWKSARLHGVTL